MRNTVARPFSLLLVALLLVPPAMATPRDPTDAFVTSFSLSGTSFSTGGTLSVTANVTVPTGNLTRVEFGFYLLNTTTLFSAVWTGFAGNGTRIANYTFNGSETAGIYELLWIYTSSQNATTPYSHQEYDNVTYADGSRVRVGFNTPTPTAPADLVVERLNVTPTGAAEGTNVTIFGAIRNVGGTPAANSTVSLVLDGNVTLGTRTVGSIAPGTNASFFLTWTATRGNHTVVATADALGEVVESNESNNTRAHAFSVAPPGTPDLSARLPSLFTPREGEWVYLEGEMTNKGNATAPFAYAELYVDGQRIASGGASLGPSTAMWIGAPWAATAGLHQVAFVVDPYNSTSESNESNNVAFASFYVLPRVDVSIEILDVRHESLRTEVGDAPNPLPRHIVSILVENHGNATTAFVELDARAATRGLQVSTQGNITSAFVSLARGESRVLELVWDPLFAVGDVTLIARIDPNGFDTQGEDNVDEHADFVGVGGLGGVIVR